MTAGDLLAALQALPPEYDKARFLYSPVPGITLFCDNWNTTEVSPTGLVWIFYGHLIPSDTYLPVEGLRTYLSILDPADLSLILFIAGPNGLEPISGISLLPAQPDGSGPYVAFNGAFTPPLPPRPPPIPGDRRRQRPSPPWLPNIPVADP